MPVLFDASIYIHALRTRGNDSLTKRWMLESPVWLSSVVLEELYAGADPKDYRSIEKLEQDFDKARRILVPNLGDWAGAGKTLSRLARKYGYEQIGRSRLTNDALIAASAARVGIVVVTLNPRDFAHISEFCPVRWRHDVP